MAVYNVNFGHGKQDSKSPGAGGVHKESEINRIVGPKVVEYLKNAGNTVNLCNSDYPADANDCLRKTVEQCNAHHCDYNISIHLNSAANDYPGDGVTTGVECWCYDKSGGTTEMGERICNKVSSLGWRNRGVKYSTGLYFLRKTVKPAILIECYFVDDRDDCMLAEKVGYDALARKIAEGIMGKTINAPQPAPNPNPGGKQVYWRVVVGSNLDIEISRKQLAEAKAKGFTDAFIVPYEKE